MRTLADITPEERAQCRGMWCEDEDGRLCIYRADHRGTNWLAICIYPDRVGVIAAKYELITPRPDLPRAWQADGTPPAGQWEHINEPRFQNHKRRFVSEWEEA